MGALKHKDQNGVVIEAGQQCEAYNEETGIFFHGEIVKIKEDFISVEDMDGDVFDIEPYHIEVEFDLRDVAEKEGLDYIETTTESNGYPANLKPALIGFETFEQAQEIAEKYGLNIESFERRDGWHLWSRDNRTAYKPYTISCEDYGDNYGEFEKMDEEDFMEREIDEALRYIKFDTLNDLERFVEEKREIWDEIEAMEDDEIVITSYGTYLETVKKHSMSWSHDTKHYIIGVI